MSYILGMGHVHAKNSLGNQFFEDLDVGTNSQWILDKIGIVDRVTTLPVDYIKTTRNADPVEGQRIAAASPTTLATIAAKDAIKNAGITPQDIGLIICNCCNPTHTAPAEAMRIAASLGISPEAYDVFSACPAFALHMNFIENFKVEALPDYVLCVSTAALTQKVNYNDRSDGAIWGDGAAAWVVSTKKKGRLKVIDTHFNADPTRCEAVVVERFGHFHQDGRAVRDFSVRQTVRLIKRLETEYNIDWTKDIFIGHQANKTMLEQITGNREIPAENHWHNVTHLGNQAGAGAPAVLSMHWDKLKSGQKIVVAVVGAGLSWGSILFEVQ